MHWITYTLFIAICEMVPSGIKWLTEYLCDKTSPEHDVKIEVERIRRKLEIVSKSQADHSYIAGVKNKLAKLEEELRKHIEDRIETVDELTTVLVPLSLLFSSFVSGLMVYNNMDDIIVELNPDWLFPAHEIICWPKAAGVISLVPWFLIVKATAGAFLRI